jgi:hypothetical protein
MGIKNRILGAGFGLLAIAACNTPSVPLPPPELPALRFQLPDPATPTTIVVLGTPTEHHAKARFYVYDRSNGEGVITTAGGDGAFTSTPFTGADGDTVQIYYDSFDGERSQDVCVQLRVNVPLFSTGCQ